MCLTFYSFILSLPAAPEEPYDGRTLYDRLKEQKDKKDSEFEESRKFKNMIRGLDDEDVDHLDNVDTKRIEEEKKQRIEELKEMREYREKVAAMQEENEDKVSQKIALGLAKFILKTFRNFNSSPASPQNPKKLSSSPPCLKSPSSQAQLSENLNHNQKPSQTQRSLRRILIDRVH